MKNNIRILYVLSFLSNAWFWLGVWVLYYLLFTNFTGIGFIEMAMIITIMLFEVPSGAFADIVGKRKTLIIAFFVVAISEIVMGLAMNFSILAISAFIGALGTTMTSGTFEAMTYDSLKELKKEKIYDKILSRQKSIAFIASAVATIIGGLLYVFIDPRAPFFAVGFMYVIACVVAFFLVEPRIDTEKITLRGYRKQLQQGFSQLFSHAKFRAVVIMLLVASIVPLFMYEMLADMLLVAYGATPIEISVAVFAILSTSAIVVHFATTISKKIGSLRAFTILSLVYGILLLCVPFIDLFVGIVLLMALAGISAINYVIRSNIINHEIASEYRAITLSTFTMLSSIPYVLFAVFLGYFSDFYTVQNVIFVLGISMIIVLFVSVINVKRLYGAEMH